MSARITLPAAIPGLLEVGCPVLTAEGARLLVIGIDGPRAMVGGLRIGRQFIRLDALELDLAAPAGASRAMDWLGQVYVRNVGLGWIWGTPIESPRVDVWQLGAYGDARTWGVPGALADFNVPGLAEAAAMPLIDPTRDLVALQVACLFDAALRAAEPELEVVDRDDECPF